MKSPTILAALALMALMTVAQAHAHLREATPADGSALTAPPSQAVLQFSEAARLTAAWIGRNGAARQVLRPLPAKMAAELVVSLPVLAPGRYVLSWRALTGDGHIVPGQIRFTVLPRGATGPAPR